MVARATQYGRSGYRRVTALLRREGWKVNHKRVERLWRQEGLKVDVDPKVLVEVLFGHGAERDERTATRIREKYVQPA